MSDGTPHYTNCFGSGPEHYVCALMEITDLRKRLETETQLLLDGNKIASRGHREEVAALREQLKDCSAAFDRQQEQLDRNAEQIATLREALSRLIEVHDAMGGKCGTVRIAAEEALLRKDEK